MKEPERPHWSECSHPQTARDRDGYCDLCGDLRRIIRVHPPKKRKPSRQITIGMIEQEAK